MQVRVGTMVVILVLAAGGAAAQDLSAFLGEATAAARTATPLRADGELITVSPEGTVRDQVIVLVRPSRDLAVELRRAGVRALVLDGGARAYVTAEGAAARPFARDAALAGSEFTREDLEPFDAARYGSPTIVDRNASQVAVSLTPRDSQYTLQVVTFDRDKKVPVKTMSYKDTLSNLVKMRRDAEYVSVGGRWLPAMVTMENFPLRTRSTLALRWREAPDLPAGLFDPASFGKPSGLAWSSPAAPSSP